MLTGRFPHWHGRRQVQFGPYEADEASTSPSAAGFFSGNVTRDSVNSSGSRWDSEVSMMLHSFSV